MTSQRWLRNFSVQPADIEMLTDLLLAKETPLSTTALAHALIEKRLLQDVAERQKRYADVTLYNPAMRYDVGAKLVFSAFKDTIGEVVGLREGNNPDVGAFNVIQVRFEDSDTVREFAAALPQPHPLNHAQENGGDTSALLTVEAVMASAGDVITSKLEDALAHAPDLVSLAGLWFPRDLLMDVDEGHLNLAEAVLDLSEGEPLLTETILSQMGGLGSAPMPLQAFSLNYTLKDDARFAEVGPSGKVLWVLSRLAPPEVLQTPLHLRATSVDYDRRLLTPEMLVLEQEIGDELSHLPAIAGELESANVTLNYPHRRAGTLPLTPALRAVFPTARKTPLVCMTLVDEQDNEEMRAWVVRNEGYVFGLANFYRKHRIPVGAYLTLARTDDPSKVVIKFDAHRARTEYLRLLVPKADQLNFENLKRSIGAGYDDQMILGIEDLQGIDALSQIWRNRPILSILKMMMPSLTRLTPQGATHAKTIYSVFNVLRRCPPGPIFATLVANPEFQYVGDNYWKIVEA